MEWNNKQNIVAGIVLQKFGIEKEYNFQDSTTARYQPNVCKYCHKVIKGHW